MSWARRVVREIGKEIHNYNCVRGFSENIGSVFCLLILLKEQQETSNGPRWSRAFKVLSILPAESVLAIQLGRLKLEKTQLGVLVFQIMKHLPGSWRERCVPGRSWAHLGTSSLVSFSISTSHACRDHEHLETSHKSPSTWNFIGFSLLRLSSTYFHWREERRGMHSNCLFRRQKGCFWISSSTSTNTIACILGRLFLKCSHFFFLLLQTSLSRTYHTFLSSFCWFQLNKILVVHLLHH